MAWPRSSDSRGMLADVSITTVTASLCVRISAQGSASAITTKMNTRLLSARHARDDPGRLPHLHPHERQQQKQREKDGPFKCHAASIRN